MTVEVTEEGKRRGLADARVFPVGREGRSANKPRMEGVSLIQVDGRAVTISKSILKALREGKYKVIAEAPTVGELAAVMGRGILEPVVLY